MILAVMAGQWGAWLGLEINRKEEAEGGLTKDRRVSSQHNRLSVSYCPEDLID